LRRFQWIVIAKLDSDIYEEIENAAFGQLL
jgi:hypothetical protein